MAGEPQQAEKLGVFISYSREDLALADQLVVTLELAGFAPTIDRVGIHGAEDWQAKLGQLIREADTVVFVLSPASAQSKVCAWEVEQAQAMGKRIIPVLCRPLDDIRPPPTLAALNYIFFYADPARPGSGWAAGMRELDRALRTDLDWLREHTRLLQRASEWQAGGRAEGRLLAGADILEAKTWVACRPREAPAPTALHLEFIVASETHEAAQASAREHALAERERLVREAEASRAAREAAQAAALAAAEQAREASTREAAAQRRTASRTRIGLLVASVLAAAAGFTGWGAWQERTRAEEQRGIAEEALANFRTMQEFAKAHENLSTSLETLSRRQRDAFSKMSEAQNKIHDVDFSLLAFVCDTKEPAPYFKTKPFRVTDAADMFKRYVEISEDLAKDATYERLVKHNDGKGRMHVVYASLATFALFASEPAKALAASEKALSLSAGDLAVETNRALALMYLGRAEEARALFLTHRDKPIPEQGNKPWQQVIGEDFAALRKAGLEHPQMKEIETALGIASK